MTIEYNKSSNFIGFPNQTDHYERNSHKLEAAPSQQLDQSSEFDHSDQLESVLESNFNYQNNNIKNKNNYIFCF